MDKCDVVRNDEYAQLKFMVDRAKIQNDNEDEVFYLEKAIRQIEYILRGLSS